MAIYTCGKCLFCFERKGSADTCPDCASMSVRFATEAETAEYTHNKAESVGNKEQELQQDGKFS